MFDLSQTTDAPDARADPDAWSAGTPADGRAAREQAAVLLRHAITEAYAGSIAVVSSFGADSAVLLALVAEIDRAVPVIFLDTKQHFDETITYRETLARHLGLTDVRDVTPQAASVAATDPQDQLWYFDPDACCKLRKVTPLAGALTPFSAWITGRKRHQAGTRAALPLIERAGGRTKINPLAGWSAAAIDAAFVERGLPRHPLVGDGYRSIGCAPCTRPTGDGDDPRRGRWAGVGKTECGIHA